MTRANRRHNKQKLSEGNTSIKKDQLKLLNFIVNTKFGIEPVYKYKRIVQVGSTHRPIKYTCTVCIGEKEITKNKMYLTKPQARNETVNLAYNKLKLGTLLPYSLKNDECTITVKDPEEGWIHGSSAGNVYTKLPNDMLAVMFKEILEQIAYKTEKELPFYYTRLQTEGGITGCRYSSIVDFDGKEYKSWGLMLNQSQAEQSAAEVCLRTNGDLPDVDDASMLIIQPYDGGTSKQIDDINCEYPPYIFTSTVLTDALMLYLNSLYLQKPKYFVKKVESQFDAAELTTDGEAKQMMDCICCFEGKVFKARCPQVVPIVKELAAVEALKYLGISNPQMLLEIRMNVRVSRYDFFERCTRSPFHQAPVKRKGWLSERLHKLGKYNDCPLERLFRSGIVQPYFPENKSYIRNLVLAEMAKSPALRNVSLFEMNDLAVAEINANNPNVFLIGNSQFSINMLCYGGKLFSRKTNDAVTLLPGQKIHQLKCEYRVKLPSVELYVKGLECEDISFPNPPLPVVTSCGTVVLLHDLESSPNAIYIVLRRTSSYLVAGILNKLILPISEIYATPLQCVEGIAEWKYRDVKLLSEITMDGVLLLTPRRYQYNTEWILQYAKTELPDRLKELKDLCIKEVERRVEEGHKCEPDAVLWNIPESEFIPRFNNTGVHVEDSSLCALRALIEAGGMMKVKLNAIDTCPTVDVPVESDEKQHRGGINRYYIWTGCQVDKFTEKKRGEAQVSYSNEMDTDVFEKEEGWELLSDDNIYTSSPELFEKVMLNNKNPNGFSGERRQYFRNVKYHENPDGHTVSQDTNDAATSAEVDGDEVERMNKEEKETDAINEQAGDSECGDDDDEPMEEEDMTNTKADEPIEDGDDGNQDGNEGDQEIGEATEGDKNIYKYVNGSVSVPVDENAATREKLRMERVEGDGKRLDGKLPQIPKMAFREHCRWFKLDEAVDVCPVLKKISVTPQFQKQIKKLIVVANSFMESKEISEKVQTSVLLDEE